MATKRARYMISVGDNMFATIEDFKLEHRVQKRSEAATKLVRLGLEYMRKASHRKRNAGESSQPDTK